MSNSGLCSSAAISSVFCFIPFEYALIAGVNDGDDDARQLAKRLKGLRCHVNLIPLNPTPAFPYERPSVERIDRFAQIINAAGIPATVRYSRGVEIGAACGQLHIEQQKCDAATA